MKNAELKTTDLSADTKSDDDFLPFSRPSLNQADIDSVVEVLKSGWITTGSKTAELESAICKYTGSKHAVAVCSATAGMHIVMLALGIGPGDEVITPSITWVSTINLIVALGATPIFVDVDRDSLMCTVDSIRKKITSRTKLIVPVHYAGASLEIDPIRQLAREKGIDVVQDAAHALGTKNRDHAVGSSGTAIFSFHPIKNITTGEGGMICTDDEQLALRLRRLRFHGLGVDAFDRETQGRAPQAEVIEPGFKYNLPDMNSVLGLGQLARLDWMNAKRASIAQHYLHRFQDTDAILPLSYPRFNHIHAWHLFIVRLDIDAVGISRDELMRQLKARNIGTGLHFRAVHLQKYYRENLPQAANSLLNTEWNSERILSLPLFPDMTLDNADRVVDAIEHILYGVTS